MHLEGGLDGRGSFVDADCHFRAAEHGIAGDLLLARRYLEAGHVGVAVVVEAEELPIDGVAPGVAAATALIDEDSHDTGRQVSLTCRGPITNIPTCNLLGESMSNR